MSDLKLHNIIWVYVFIYDDLMAYVPENYPPPPKKEKKWEINR